MRTPNRACPACKAVGRDKNDDHLFLMKDGKAWACSKNSDLNPPHPPYIEGAVQPKTFQQAVQQVVPIAASQPMPLRLSFEQIQQLGGGAIRGVPEDVVNFYQTKIEYNPSTRDQVKDYYPLTSKGELVSYHIRELPKNFFHLHTRNNLPNHLDLFGMYTMNTIKNPTHLIITEGEIDAMATFYILAGIKRVSRVRVLSLPTGNNLAAVQQNVPLLNTADNLYLYPDQDDAGFKLIPEFWKLFPQIKIIYTSEKDASDMLDKNKTDEMVDAFNQAEKYKPATIVTASTACTCRNKW